MSLNLEDQLTAGMREQVTGVSLAGDVLGRATRRHRRRTAVIRTGYALGMAGLAGALAIGLTAGTGGSSSPQNPPAVQAAPASLRLANAAAASDNISYRMKITTRTSQGALINSYEGAFDPKTATGYVRSPQDDSVTTELLINGTRYIGGEPPLQPLPPDKQGGGEKYGRYGQYAGTFDRLSLYGDGDTVLGAAAPDPAALFKALQQANSTITENPDGTLHFEFTTQVEKGSSSTKGDVTLNAEARIAKIVLTSSWQSTVKGRLDSGTSVTTLELSDYGLAVHVDRPTDVVPA